MDARSERAGGDRPVQVPAGPVTLEGDLSLPPGARALVLFAPGRGMSRLSPRNRDAAALYNEARLATLLVDLLTAGEMATDIQLTRLCLDVGLLAERLLGVTDWLTRHPETQHLRIGYFGTSTWAGAALLAAAERPAVVGAVVSRGGRPDLAGPTLMQVRAPTLLIVGGNDHRGGALNRAALAQLRWPKRLVVVPGAGHLFEEPGTLVEAARLAREWHDRYLTPGPARRAGSGRLPAPARGPAPTSQPPASEDGTGRGSDDRAPYPDPRTLRPTDT